MLGRLRAQNPDLAVARWCVFHYEVKESPQGHLVVFGVGDEDVAVLKRRLMRVNYAFTSLSLRLTKTREENTSGDPRPSGVEPPMVETKPEVTMGTGKGVEASEEMLLDDLKEVQTRSASVSSLTEEQMDL